MFVQRRLGMFACVLALAVVGCRPLSSHRFVGTWVGHLAPGSRAAERLSDANDTEPIQVTLELASDGSANMWQGASKDRLTGTWSVLQSGGLTARLQLVASHAAGEADEIRNFEIKFSEGAAQFELVEQGADPKALTLVFERQSS